VRETDDGLLFEKESARKKMEQVGRVIMVGSGKGGVGKSFVASGLAITLSRLGHRTGILDLDIHGASLPGYFGVSPPLTSTERGLKPKVKEGVEIMSVALFTGNRPVAVRGSEKQNLVNEVFALTDWGHLEYLVVDLPPTTGDEVLSAFELFGKKTGLILVTTPSPLAVSIVSRLRQLAKGEGIPVLGLVINMAYLKKGKRKSFPFGRSDSPSMEKRLSTKIIAEIPLDEGVSSKGLARMLTGRNEISPEFKRIAAFVASS